MKNLEAYNFKNLIESIIHKKSFLYIINTEPKKIHTNWLNLLIIQSLENKKTQLEGLINYKNTTDTIQRLSLIQKEQLGVDTENYLRPVDSGILDFEVKKIEFPLTNPLRELQNKFIEESKRKNGIFMNEILDLFMQGFTAYENLVFSVETDDISFQILAEQDPVFTVIPTYKLFYSKDLIKIVGPDTNEEFLNEITKRSNPFKIPPDPWVLDLFSETFIKNKLNFV